MKVAVIIIFGMIHCISSGSSAPERCVAVDVDPSESYPNVLPRVCGIYNTDRITGGIQAKVFEFPWMAVLHENEQSFCAGTLIHKRYVLTAAQCLRDTSIFQVRLGEHTIGQDRDCNANDDEEDCAPPAQDYDVECVRPHQNYKPRFMKLDIGLVRLATDAIMTDHIQPICLPVTRILRETQPVQFIITGWGANETIGSMASILHKAKIPVADKSICQEMITENSMRKNLTMDDSLICAGGKSLPDSCAGDSGGPQGWVANYNGAMRFVQFGIVSLGLGCGLYPSIYTNVTFFMDWIKANIKP